VESCSKALSMGTWKDWLSFTKSYICKSSGNFWLSERALLL
jgi:hypothetical protein